MKRPTKHPRKRGDVVAAVEAAYRVDLRDDGWLAALIEAVDGACDFGAGALAFTYDARRPMQEWIRTTVTCSLPPPAAAFFGSAAYARTETAMMAQMAERIGPLPAMPRLCRFSDFGGADTRATATMSTQMGFADIVGINATDGAGAGAVINLLQARRRALSSAETKRLTQLAAHVGAAARLRRRLAAADQPAVAVLTGDGRIAHAEGVARSLAVRTALSLSARRSDQARGALRRRDPDAALSAWSALVEGRWSLVERVERDGKRLLFAHENPPDLLDPRALTPRERAVAQLVALGVPNKLVAYELGVSIGAVGRYLHLAMRKLRVRSRAALVREVQALRLARIARLSRGLVVAVSDADHEASRALASLSEAERAVAALAASGATNAAIARARSSSPRTIANQLQSIYAKLGIGTRAELVRVVTDRRDPTN